MIDSTLRKNVYQVLTRGAGFMPIDKVGGVDDLLYRAATTEFRHQTGSEPTPEPRRVTVGEVDVGSPFGRLFIEHDQRTDDVSISGVAFSLDDGNADVGLARAFRRATSAFRDAGEDAEAQEEAKAAIAALTHAIISKNGVVADAVRRQKFRVKFGV